MAYTDQQYADARTWATGKTGDEILSLAGQLGLSQADLGQVFGANASQVLANTGYGSGPDGNTDPYSGVRKDANQWTYNGEAGNEWSFAEKPQQLQAQRSGGGISLSRYEKNPYLDQMAAGITQQATRNLNEQIMPGLRSNAIAAGGFGDARHGVAEGLAIGRTNDAITNSLSSLYGTDYNNQMERNLKQYGMDQQYDLGGQQIGLGYAGLGNQLNIAQMGNDTQRYGVDANNATQRYGVDQNYSLGMTNAGNNRYGTDKQYEVGMANASASQSAASASAQNAANNFQLGQQQLGINTMLGLYDRQQQSNANGIAMGTNIQNTAYDNYQRFNQQANSMGQGFASNTQSGGGSDPLMGAAGLARVGQSWMNQSGASLTSNGGWGTGNGFGNQDLGAFV